MSGRPLLLGHRGARAVRSIPENTLASFDRALADGCDGFEFDVRRTADGEVVVCHDPEYQASKARKVEIAAADGSALAGLPRLEEVLNRYQRSAFLDIELKVPGVEEASLTLLGKYPPQGFVLSSFLPEVLKKLYTLNPDVPLGLICENRTELGRWRDVPLEWVIPHSKLFTRELVNDLHAARRRVLVWTVNEREAMKRFADWGVDGIVSDQTALLVKMISQGS